MGDKKKKTTWQKNDGDHCWNNMQTQEVEGQQEEEDQQKKQSAGELVRKGTNNNEIVTNTPMNVKGASFTPLQR